MLKYQAMRNCRADFFYDTIAVSLLYICSELFIYIVNKCHQNILCNLEYLSKFVAIV